MATEEQPNLDPDVEYQLLSGQEKAAILLSALGPSATKLIFKHMKDNDVKRMINSTNNHTELFIKATSVFT